MGDARRAMDAVELTAEVYAGLRRRLVAEGFSPEVAEQLVLVVATQAAAAAGGTPPPVG